MPNNRKPAHLELVGGKTPRQRIWEKIRELKEFTAKELIGELPGNIHKTTTRTYVKSLFAGGYLRLKEFPFGESYRLIRDNGVEAPRVRKDGTEVVQGRAQENLWQTLRRAKNPMTPAELAAMASTENIPVSPVAAGDYLKNLEKAGYLIRDKQKRVKLKAGKNTGPRAPMVQRIKQIYDPNLAQVVWSQGADHEEG